MIAPREELGGAERGKNKERIQRKQENRPYAVTNVGRVMYRTSSILRPYVLEVLLLNFISRNSQKKKFEIEEVS